MKDETSRAAAVCRVRLKRSERDILANIDVHMVMDQLYQDDVISSDLMEDLLRESRTNSKRSCTKMLLEHVYESADARMQHAFDSLLIAIKDVDYDMGWLTEDLEMPVSANEVDVELARRGKCNCGLKCTKLRANSNAIFIESSSSENANNMIVNVGNSTTVHITVRSSNDLCQVACKHVDECDPKTTMLSVSSNRLCLRILAISILCFVVGLAVGYAAFS